MPFGGLAFELTESPNNAVDSTRKSRVRRESRLALKNSLYAGICETIQRIGKSFR